MCLCVIARQVVGWLRSPEAEQLGLRVCRIKNGFALPSEVSVSDGISDGCRASVGDFISDGWRFSE